MKTHQVQQKTERRISAALRLAFVAALLLVADRFGILSQHGAAPAGCHHLHGAGGWRPCGYAVRIYNRTDGTSYKFGWIVPRSDGAGGGADSILSLERRIRQQKRLDLKKLRHAGGAGSRNRRAAPQARLEKLRRECPQWERTQLFIWAGKDFSFIGDTEATYLPTGEMFLQDMLEQAGAGGAFHLSGVSSSLRRDRYGTASDGGLPPEARAAGVEVKIIFDDFGSMMRMPAGTASRHCGESGVEVQVFNPVHHYVNRLYFNYRDHRKIVCIDGSTAYTGGANVADEYANLIRPFRLLEGLRHPAGRRRRLGPDTASSSTCGSATADS